MTDQPSLIHVSRWIADYCPDWTNEQFNAFYAWMCDCWANDPDYWKDRTMWQHVKAYNRSVSDD